MEKQGLDYKKTFLLGFGFLGVTRGEAHTEKKLSASDAMAAVGD